MSSDNSDRDGRAEADDPSSRKELGSRIALVLDLYESRKSAASVAGKSVDQLQAYVKGTSAAPFAVLARLAVEKGVDLRWLATGAGTMKPDPEWTDGGNRVSVEAKPGAPSGADERGVEIVRAENTLDRDLDEELHALVIDGIVAVYKEENVGLPPRDLGRLAARMHTDLANTYDDPDERKIAVKGMLAQLRRGLHEAPAGANTKRRA